MHPHKTYYPYFDYLRALAAVGVFVSHADFHHELPGNLGNACVQLFFALSGFLIGGILLQSKRGDLPRFYFNRAARIWIPYVVAILLLALVAAVKQGFHDPKFLEFFFYMVTFVYNWFGPPQLANFTHRMPLDGTANHFWSICVEEQFYLVAPFLIVFFNRIVLLACLAAATIFSPDYFASISLGVVLALLEPKTWVLVGSAFLGTVAAAIGSYIASVAFVSITIIGTLARIPGKPTLLGKIAGGASYPFYLNHWIGLFGINAGLRLGLPFWLAWCAGLTLASIFSVVHYLAIDRTIAIYRTIWFSQRRGMLLCAVAFALVTIGLIGGAFLYR